MLESFAAWILNTYIGDYFGNVNTHQLRMSLKNGEIELERLPLKRDLIKYLGLPLEAKTGFIGKISIKFPSWHSFTSEPLVITIEDLFLIIKPITNFTYNEEEENRAQQEFKLSQLDQMEMRWKALHDKDLTEPNSYYSSSYSWWLNYGSSLINNVLMNIHLKISSIHIRYEDYSTIPGCPFASGVIIRSLTICSTDHEWQPKFVTRTTSGNGNNSSDNFLFKLIDMESFSCYLDTETTLFGHLNFEVMVDCMRQTLDNNLNRKGAEVEHAYLIAPVNGKCYLKRNCSEMSLKSCQQPRTVIDVQLERVPIMMTAIQYKHLLDWSLAFQTQKTLWRYRKWRPMIQHRNRKEKTNVGDEDDDAYADPDADDSIRYEFEPKIWWHFAVNANLEEYRQRRQRFNWHFILRRARDVVEYHRAYLEYLINPESFTKEMRYVKDRVESQFTLDELCSIREMVFWKADQILKKQALNNMNEMNMQQDPIEPRQTSGYWFLPFNIMSNFYYNYQNSPIVSQEESQNETHPSNTAEEIEVESCNDSNFVKRHRRNISTTSPVTTEDIFLTRDAVYYQFNFQIHNSSFQLIAFNSIDEQQQQDQNEQTFVSGGTSFMSSFSINREYQQRNLLLEFEFNQMKIGVDITNPNAYSCRCHQKRSTSNGPTVVNNANNQRTMLMDLANIQQQKTLTQNELNQLQLDLDFECHNLNLTLFKTDDTIISETDRMQKLITAQLIGCGIKFRFCTDSIGIDGRMESLELLDLITSPKTNKHKRVLSIGKNNNTIDLEKIDEQHPVEKALSFSLSRHMNENILRVNIEMASFCYVHSSLLVYELSLCRRCFSDVLEAYFSRAFKERVKAATTEVLRGIVPGAQDDNDSSYSTIQSNSSNQASLPPRISKFSLFGGKVKNNSAQSSASIRQRKASSKKSSSSTNLFVDNFRLNVFIRSPVIICPISPSSCEVVVFHLGHMLLNNHNHSSDIATGNSTSLVAYKPYRKYGVGSNQFFHPSPSSAPSISPHLNNSYNAEIRDLSVYSLDCSKNVNCFKLETVPDTIADFESIIPVEKLYYCDKFGVPILQKTIIEIVLERKTLFSSMFSDSKIHRKTPEVPSPLPPSNIVDGLNLISSVNSIDPLVLPKKFSIRQHLCADLPPGLGSSSMGHQDKQRKQEMVLSIEISSIDVRFSYTDLLVFWHIMNTLTCYEQPHTESNSSLQPSIDCRNADITSTNENNNSDDTAEMLAIEQLALSSSGLNAEEFRSRLNNLIDLGFDPKDSLRALAMKNGDIIEAAYMLSSTDQSPIHQQMPPRSSPDSLNDGFSDQVNQSSDDNHSQCTSEVSCATTDGVATTITTGSSCTLNQKSSRSNQKDRKRRKDRQSSLLLSILSMIEVKILNGSIRIIDDCNQLDLPLLELGITDFRLMQYYTSPTIEAHAQTNFYCDYYNSHLSGWEPFIENCHVSFSWKHHEPRCHLKSMLNTATIATTNRIPVARKKLAIKIEIRKMFNLNVSRTMLNLIEKVHNSWRKDIENFMSLPVERRAFRHRQPFIPFALKNETGNDLQIFIGNARKIFTNGKSNCDLKSVLDVPHDTFVYFDCIDSPQQQHNGSVSKHHNLARASRSSTSASISPLKIYVKVLGWQATFPLSIEREGTFVRHVISERFTNQSAILVFEISLQPNAIKLITVRSSLLITNRTTKTVELKFVNTAMLTDVRTSYMVLPDGVFPVPLDLLYARIQLRPCDLGIGTCSTYINWNHVRKFGELDCSLQICTPITHTQHGSYSKSQAYVVSVLVERNSIGALIESRNIFRSFNGSNVKNSPLVTLPSHTITLLPPLRLANRLPYELRFKILNSANVSGTSATIKSGDDYSIHYISPLEPFAVEFQMEHFPRCRPLHIEPGAIKNYQTHIDMYDARNRLLILNADITVQSGSPKPSNAMTITIYAPYWIVNRSGLPLIFAQESGVNSVEDAAGQYEEHEQARSISPLLFSFADPDSPQYCIMRLGRMMPGFEPRWGNLFCLEKGTFYRRLRVTEYSSDPKQSIPQEKIYEFVIDIRQGRDRYNQTKIVTVAPRFQIENLTSFKLEFVQKCLLEQSCNSNNHNSYHQDYCSTTNNGFAPSHMSSPLKPSSHRRSYSSSSIGSQSDKAQIISALPKSNMPFHWPDTDRPKLLCVRIASIIGCLWSGSFDVGSEPSVSFHLNIRDDTGRSNFIRVEILLQNATYFIVFTDANQLPPPIRVENFSQVSVEFFQVGSNYRTLVRPNSSVPYALDEPTKPPHLTVCAPGGSTSTYDLNSSAPGNALTYENFYYLAFEETFSSCQFGPNYYLDHDDEAEQLMYMMAGADLSFLENDVGSKMLVLDVPDDDGRWSALSGITMNETRSKPVVLGRKERGKRSQLWRYDKSNRLIHEGSSPPLEPPGFQDLGIAEVKFGPSKRPTVLMVLDVMDEELSNNPSQAATSIPLAVCKWNPQRSATQTWHFTEDGRLRCLKYWNMFVQPLMPHTECSDVFQTGALAVITLGPPESTVSKATIPKEQAILKQKMRKGSGVLNISILADGPSRVLRIKDNQLTANGRQLNLVNFNCHNNYNNSDQNNDLAIMSLTQQSNQSFLMKFLSKTELELNLLVDSVGVSVISKTNEELFFLFMKKIILELLCNPAECRLNYVVEDFQVDNQSLNCEKEVVLYVSNLEHQEQDQQLSRTISVGERPAFTFNLHKLFIPNVEIHVFKSFQISINDLVLNLEELVLLKFLEFLNYDPVDSEMDEISSGNSASAMDSNVLLYHASGNVVSSSLSRSMQFFFAYLLIQIQRIKLSVFTSTTSLGKFLTDLKKKAGIKLIGFEEALIQLRPFRKIYSLMTRKFLQDSIHQHYHSELRSQAAKILGTVDFLGNPVGFINNVVEGFNEFYYEHSLRGLIMNVTHGISDSTAKVTSVLSESLGFVTMDDRHQEIRRKIKQQTGGIGGQRSHLMVGAFGLAHGILGGITSVITQTYDGIVNHGGVTGFLSGLSKGVLGTFTKPAVGMLDFASGAATAVRDSSRKACFGMNGRQVKRIRLPRTLTIDGLLTRYQSQQSQWQSRFYNTNDFGSQREYEEQFVHVFPLSDRHFVLLTTERLYFFHAPIKKCNLPPEEDDFGAEETGFRQQQDLILTNCPIQQLQILPLEQFHECNHHRMMLHEGKYFLKTHGTCSDLVTMIGTTESLETGGMPLCNFIEFRQSGRPNASPTIENYSPVSERQIVDNNRKQSFEYPRHLNPCYVYCDCPQMIQKIIQLINEAKHLQEERKFEVSNLDMGLATT